MSDTLLIIILFVLVFLDIILLRRIEKLEDDNRELRAKGLLK